MRLHPSATIWLLPCILSASRAAQLLHTWATYAALHIPETLCYPQCNLQAQQKRRKQQLVSTSSGAAADIPGHELKALQSFLKKVYIWRGWQGGPYHLMQAWHEAEVAAATTAGGSWVQDFDGLQLSSENCHKLLAVINQTFFAGKLLKRMRAKPQPQQQGEQHDGTTTATEVEGAGSKSRTVDSHSSSSWMQCKIVQAYGPNDTWLCYFDPDDNVIYINRWRWGKHITAENPINCEGVICTSRLQMLLHTLAHELVHAIVFHMFPDIDKNSPAYLPDDRHGPIFQLLNKQLFGHSSTALEHVQLQSCRH